jgi:hypothetical protein
MVCFLAVKVEIVNTATLPTVGAEPRIFFPSEKVTSSPSAGLPYFDATVTVNVTGCPTWEGEPLLVSVICDGPATYSVSTGDVLGALSESPE